MHRLVDTPVASLVNIHRLPTRWLSPGSLTALYAEFHLTMAAKSNAEIASCLSSRQGRDVLPSVGAAREFSRAAQRVRPCSKLCAQHKQHHCIALTRDTKLQHSADSEKVESGLTEVTWSLARIVPPSARRLARFIRPGPYSVSNPSHPHFAWPP